MSQLADFNSPVINSILALQASSSERPLVMLWQRLGIDVALKGMLWLQEWAHRVLVRRLRQVSAGAEDAVLASSSQKQFWARVRVQTAQRLPCDGRITAIVCRVNQKSVFGMAHVLLKGDIVCFTEDP